ALLFDGKAVKSRLLFEYGNEQKVARQWASKWNSALRRARLPELVVIVKDEPTGVHLDVAGRRIDF
ncbi:MAG: hypothetical protein NZP34_15490, partial [Caldilineales bacterium]|nr:hypothetical protein [Caldilineales bacterium]